MKYLVLGLGNLGRAIAENLTRTGHEVIGIDKNANKVEAVKHSISEAIQMDTTEEGSLSSLPLSEMDAIFVTFSKDIGISVQTVALLKHFDAENIIVRSISPIHDTIIHAIGVTQIITPEEDYAAMYASRSQLGKLFKQWYAVTRTHHLYKINAPESFVGQSLHTIDLENNFGMRLVGIERSTISKNLLGIQQAQYSVLNNITDDLVIEKGDILLLFGKMEALHKLVEI